ncbi:MAG TPA: SRPBCC family protein [Steroidobacteraceae bacterium]|jgi:hypothetical protein|nr:SRPBCC family protein [Steroidobacteraceae bacterium]
MFKKILIGLVVIIVAILGYATTKPDTFSVSRSIAINAKAETVHGFINDFNQWPNWSPWEKLDPEMKRTFSGPTSGPGAVYEWQGNSKVGKGRMEILQSTPQQIRIKLDFIEPIEGNNLTVFDLNENNGVTQVNWSMSGPSPYLSKVMQVFMNMDSIIGKDFESGLANLKARAETQAH